MEADIVIVGAGLAGLRCGIELLHKSPNQTIVLLEKYNYKGGRVVTFKKTLQDVKGKCTHLQWENGAGRIHNDHTKVLDLVKQYKLTTSPLSTDLMYVQKGQRIVNSFDQLLEMFLPSLQETHPDLLAKYTLRQLFEMILKEKANPFLLMFPYRAEVDVLRADMGIQSFTNEMGTYDGYVVVKEGLSAIVDGMVKEFEQLGGQIFLKQSVTDIQKDSKSYLVVAETPSGQTVWKAKKVICALHSEALKTIPCFSSWPLLDHLQMEPLLRIYAVFPTEKGISWFSDLEKTVSPGPIRYFIPINPSCGIAMISYTDSKDAYRLLNILRKQGEEALEDFVLGELQAMFPEKKIPDTLFFKTHPWYEGCTYWLPGSYNPKQLSEDALQPFPETMPGVYCCGESFSLRQAWMEGALEHADELIKKFF